MKSGLAISPIDSERTDRASGDSPSSEISTSASESPAILTRPRTPHFVWSATTTSRSADRISASSDGGHSWLDFGAPSAIHTLVRLAARLAGLEVPREPKSTFNIGMIEGGTSVNTIAQRAALLLDLRSLEPAVLEELVRQVERIVANVERVDAAKNVVLLEGPNARYVEVKVKNPALMKDIKAGDKVEVTYVEAFLVEDVGPAK